MSKQLEKVSPGCVHCDDDSAVPLWGGREHEYNTTDETFTFVRCASCGVVRLDPRPAVSELSAIYPPDYYAYNLLSERGDSKGLTDKLKMLMYQRRVVAQIKRLNRDGPLRVLDVGCGDGRLLDWYAASSVGSTLETHGIEMNEEAAATARRQGHRVVAGRFEVDTELESHSFDLILASHVIEHVDDPVRFAKRAAELLKPGGLFVAATPNWDSVEAKRLRGHWGGNHFPRHWTLYDARSVETLASLVGLTVERIEYQPNPIFWVWSFHSRLKSKFPNRTWPDTIFPPVGVFSPSMTSFVLLTVFTMLDLVLRPITGRTASMSVEMRSSVP